MMPTRRPKVVVLGMMSKMPVAGVVWQTLHYLLGIDLLGFEAYYVEAHGRAPSMLMTGAGDDGSAIAAGFISSVMHRFGFDRRWAFHALHDDGRCYGLSAAELARLYQDAACLINLHGGTEPLPEHYATGRLVYLETDPVQLQLELDRGHRPTIEFLEAHSAHFTFAENWGRPGCGLPTSELFEFIPTRQPVVVEVWQTPPIDPGERFTTIGNWDQRWRDVEIDGETYRWSKKHEFAKVLDLPGRCHVELELALAGCEDEDIRMLESKGWIVRRADGLSSSVDSYRTFIRRSRGEFTVAKDQNVRLRSGWFSDRSATYLAAGRPVVTQDTGFGCALPTGEGLLAFSSIDEAVEALARVTADDTRHRRAAAELARAFFSYDVVLPPMFEAVGFRPIVPGMSRAGSALQRDDTAFPRGIPADLVIEPVAKHPLRLCEESEARIRAAGWRGTRHTSEPAPPSALAAPEASVVVVTWNAPVLTRLCLDSVLANTEAPAFELVVVDNASGPETLGYLEGLAATDSRVRLLRNEVNEGFPAAVNTGLAASRGEVLAILNSDTIVPSGWLAGLSDHLADPAIGMVGPVTNEADGEARIRSGYRTYGQLLAFAAQRPRDGEARDVEMLTMFCVAMRRDTFDRVGLLDESFGTGLFEDDDYSMRMQIAGYRLVCAEDVFVHHFGSGSFGALVPSGERQTLFDRNRTYFETKWGAPWKPRSGRPDAAYVRLVTAVRAAVEEIVPPGEEVAVVSRGDDALVALPGRTARHFPAAADGSYAGFYPADDADAIGEIESLHRSGCTYLVFPATATWWLERYPMLGDYLAQTPRTDRSTAVDGEICTIFRLDRGADHRQEPVGATPTSTQQGRHQP